MFKAGRYIYAVFMCHLAIEKALKGIYAKRYKKDPPRIHNLNYFCERIKVDLDSEDLEFIDRLNSLSVLTRYPDDLERLLKDYGRKRTKEILVKTGEVLVCLKQSLSK